MRRSLDNLTLQVEEGEVFGFLGPNGAGKTTTLKLLMGLIFPTAGTARVRGRSIDDVACTARSATCPSSPTSTIISRARVLDYYARFFGYARGERRERVERFLERVGLAAAADVQLRKFSKGMLQRVGIAQAILHDPQVVFLDEPMSGLDPVGRREVRDIILELKQQGRTVFFSTHILSDAEMLCDRVAVLVGGKLQGVGAPGEIIAWKCTAWRFCSKRAKATLPRGLADAPLRPAGASAWRCRKPISTRARTIAPLRCPHSLGFAGASDAGGLFFAAGRPRKSCSRRSRWLPDEFDAAIPGVVAVNTFREAVRDRVLYNLVFFALLMIGAAILVGQISIGIERLVIINLGLSAISIFGLVMAVFIGVGLVYKEMEKRTLYSLLAKPIRRWQFLVGKYAGLLLTLAVNTSLMTLGLAAALFYVGRPFVRSDAPILVAVYFILLELALVTALALFFSCFSSPMLSTLFTLGIYIAGFFPSDIREFGAMTQSPA